MAENIDSSADALENVPTSSTRRSARKTSLRLTAPRFLRARAARPAATTPSGAPQSATTPTRGRRKGNKQARSLVIVTMVAGLVATVALPAYAATRTPEEAVTLQQVAADNAQSLVVASEATPDALDRDSYSATTPEEIDKKKAEEAAAARAKAAASSNVRGSVASVDLSMTAPGSGEVRWPVTSFTYESFNTFRPSNRPNHNGFDMMAPSGQPIFAAAAGVVRTATDSGGSYGVVVMIDSVVGGQTVSTTYAHMTYGTRVVSAGETVAAGQLLGQVGQTGNATASHLHFEVKINGSLVDPLAWLQTNAG